MSVDNPFGKKPEVLHIDLPKIEVNRPSFTDNDPIQLNNDIPDKKIEEVKIEETNTVVGKRESKKERILKEHGGIESNIPVNSAYWKLKW